MMKDCEKMLPFREPQKIRWVSWFCFVKKSISVVFRNFFRNFFTNNFRNFVKQSCWIFDWWRFGEMRGLDARNYNFQVSSIMRFQQWLPLKKTVLLQIPDFFWWRKWIRGFKNASKFAVGRGCRNRCPFSSFFRRGKIFLFRTVIIVDRSKYTLT